MKEKILKLLGDVNADQVDVIIELITQRLLNKLKPYQSDIATVPAELEHIVIELTIERFNRIGSEGMKKEDTDGHNVEYQDNGLERYMDDIREWINSLDTTNPKKGKIRFL